MCQQKASKWKNASEPDLSIKKETGRETVPNGSRPSTAAITGSTISISELLDYVNEYFPEILPEDVLKHYGTMSGPPESWEKAYCILRGTARKKSSQGRTGR